MKGSKRRRESEKGFSEETLEDILFNDAMVSRQQGFEPTKGRGRKSHGGRSYTTEPPDEVLLANDYETEVAWTSSKTRCDKDVTERRGKVNQTLGFECDELSLLRMAVQRRGRGTRPQR